MANNKTKYLENAMLNHVLRGNVGSTALAQPSAVYLALYTVAPGENGGGTEVTGNGYQRRQIFFSVPTGGVTSNSAPILFPVSTAAWGNIPAFGIHDAPSGGNLLYRGDFSSVIQIDAANRQIEIETGTLVVEEL